MNLMQITIYSTTTCPYCKMLKDFLNAKNLPFTEKLVDMDETAKVEMATISGGFLGVPFIAITLENGNKEIVIGFDQGRLNSILGIQP
jgi:glutaredoxin